MILKRIRFFCFDFSGKKNNANVISAWAVHQFSKHDYFFGRILCNILQLYDYSKIWLQGQLLRMFWEILSEALQLSLMLIKMQVKSLRFY